MPHGGHLQYGHRSVLEPCSERRDELQRRERLHADGHVCLRNLHRLESGDLRGQRPVSCGGNLQHDDRRVHESGCRQRYRMQRRERLYSERYMPERHVHGVEPRHLQRSRRMPHGRHLRHDEREVFDSDGGRWNDVQRWECVHEE